MIMPEDAYNQKPVEGWEGRLMALEQSAWNESGAAGSHALSENHHAVPSSSLLLWVLLWYLACEIVYGSTAWQIAYQQKVS